MSGTSVNPTSQVSSSAMMVLPIVGNLQYNFRVDPNGITSIPNFIQIYPVVLKLNDVGKQPSMVSLIRVHFMHNVQGT
jgi:hypothetical protein